MRYLSTAAVDRTRIEQQDSPPPPKLVLNSIKRLTLDQLDFEDEHTDDEIRPFDSEYFYQVLSKWFPNLEQLTIICNDAHLETLERNVHLLASLNGHQFLSHVERDRLLEKYSGRHSIHIL